MPSAESLVDASYIICGVTLVSLALYVLLDLRCWAKRARDAEKN